MRLEKIANDEEGENEPGSPLSSLAHSLAQEMRESLLIGLMRTLCGAWRRTIW